jgi:hypothetical protein
MSKEARVELTADTQEGKKGIMISYIPTGSKTGEKAAYFIPEERFNDDKEFSALSVRAMLPITLVLLLAGKVEPVRGAQEIQPVIDRYVNEKQLDTTGEWMSLLPYGKGFFANVLRAIANGEVSSLAFDALPLSSLQ